MTCARVPLSTSSTDSLASEVECVYDPRGMSHAKPHLAANVEYAADAYDAITDADVMVIATEWPEFAALDLDELRSRLARPVIVDMRNVFDPVKVAAAGIAYHSIGRRVR